MFDDSDLNDLKAPTRLEVEPSGSLGGIPAAGAPEPAVHIWTIQLGRWRLAKAQDIFLLDITAKSGVHAFAPDFGVVLEYKRGEIGEEEYTRIYLDRMSLSRIRNPEKWAQLKNKDRVALACYCKPGVFCHRRLFALEMKNYLEKEGMRVQLEGELK